MVGYGLVLTAEPTNQMKKPFPTDTYCTLLDGWYKCLVQNTQSISLWEVGTQAVGVLQEER